MNKEQNITFFVDPKSKARLGLMIIKAWNDWKMDHFGFLLAVHLHSTKFSTNGIIRQDHGRKLGAGTFWTNSEIGAFKTPLLQLLRFDFLTVDFLLWFHGKKHWLLCWGWASADEPTCCPLPVQPSLSWAKKKQMCHFSTKNQESRCERTKPR